jgi:choice-of-anchor A domain-containing protein
MGKLKYYTIWGAVLALSVGPVRWAIGGSLLGYNVVVAGTLTTNSHVDGATFVDNLATQNQPEFAQSAAAGSGNTLNVAGSVSGSGLTLGRGVFRHAGSLPTDFTLNLNNGSSQVTDSALSINCLAEQMNSAGAYFNSLPALSAQPSGGSIHFASSGSGLTVYSVAASALAGQNESISISAAAGSSLLIVVTGDMFDFNSSEHVNISGSGQQVMWYFPNANAINLGDSTWMGSILAPNATLTDNNQNISGGVYVENFDQTAEVHLSDPSMTAGQPMFTGRITVVVPGPPILPALLAGVMMIASPAVVRRRRAQRRPMI